jgi:hypothetical protein
MSPPTAEERLALVEKRLADVENLCRTFLAFVDSARANTKVRKLLRTFGIELPP